MADERRRADAIVAGDPAEVIDRAGLARLLGRSLASIDRDDAAGRLPAGFRVGRSRRWLRREVLDWLAAGAPGRKAWEAGKGRKEAPGRY